MRFSISIYFPAKFKISLSFFLLGITLLCKCTRLSLSILCQGVYVYSNIICHNQNLELFVFLCLVLSSLYICGVGKDLYHSVTCHLVILIVSFALQKLFSFIRWHLLIGDLIAYTIDALLKKFSPVPMSSKLFPTFSSLRFSVSDFMLRTFIYFALSFV